MFAFHKRRNVKSLADYKAYLYRPDSGVMNAFVFKGPLFRWGLIFLGSVAWLAYPLLIKYLPIIFKINQQPPKQAPPPAETAEETETTETLETAEATEGATAEESTATSEESSE
jgi:hypothetical protein